MIFVTSAK